MSSSEKTSLISSIYQHTGADQQLLDKLISVPKDINNGDFALPCFPLAKAKQINPAEYATDLAKNIDLPPEFAKVEAVGPYVNFFLNRTSEVKKIINRVIESGENYGKISDLDAESIVIDYSSPNIAKPFHIGHLRTTIIGLALHNIFRHLGHQVTAVNHLGDWGTQFGFVYAGMKLTENHTDLSEQTINFLLDKYIYASDLRKRQEANNPELLNEQEKDFPDVNQMARSFFLDLEAGEDYAKKFWETARQISLDYLKNIYQELGVEFDHYTGESFYIPLLDENIQAVKDAGIYEKSDDAFGVDLGEELGFARLYTEDQRTLYLTRDLATANYRYHTYQANRLLYVVGAPQSLHLKQLEGILKKMKHPAGEMIIHVSYGHVPGISTRNLKGNADNLSLSGLLEEARSRAREAYQQNTTEKIDQEQVINSVALSALYFNYLSRTNIKDFHFDWQEALNFQGDTGPYLLYALARLNSIITKAEESGFTVSRETPLDLLEDAESYALAHQLKIFPEVLEKITTDYEPCHLTSYLLDLAKQISKNYKTLRVIGEENQDLATARLALFQACAVVLKIGIKLLGVQPLKRM